MTCEKTPKRECPLRRKIAGLRTRVEKLDICVRLYRDRLKKLERAVEILGARVKKFDGTNCKIDRWIDVKLAEDGIEKIVEGVRNHE